MNFFQKLKTKEILLHLFFWMVAWLFFVYFFSYNSGHMVYTMWLSGLLIPITVFVTYIIAYRLIPNYLLTKKYWQFTLYSFYVFVFSAYIVVIIIYVCLILILKFNVSSVPPMARNFVSIMIVLYLVVGVVSVIKLLNSNFKTISRNKELQNKILETQLQLKEQELNYLKKQIHPHFLFNTLNTIYGLALKSSEHTPTVILKLSNLLDYILYQINKPTVSLREEVLHIKEYVELERIRFQESLKISFEADKIDESIQIAPMLLIPFVENAFKHGSRIGGFLQVEIHIKVSDSTLDFLVVNSALCADEENEPGGIGLENIQKRLDLNYNENYQLRTRHENNRFYAELSIFDLNKGADA